MSRQQRQQQQQHHHHHHQHSGVGVVTESVTFKLVCDMQHLRGKVDLVCSAGAALAQRWVEEVVRLGHQHAQHQQHRGAVESRLRSELEELVLELVDVSVEVQKMKERKEQVQRFFYLTERRSSWCQVYDDSDSDTELDEVDESVDIKIKMNVETQSTKKTSKGEAKAMLKMIDLDECDQVIDRLTTLLLGYLTAGEREEEERALRSKTHQHLSDASDQARRLPTRSSSSTSLRLHGDQHDDSLLR